MNTFISKSQCMQDAFAWDILGPAGTFLDIGSGHPSEKSNSFALERMGWTGVLVEVDPYCVGLIKALRNSPLIEEDATKIDWFLVFSNPPAIDFLSLDVDFDSPAVLRNLLAANVRFRVIVCEHDSYRFGTSRRDEMVSLLTANGYDILCADVMDQGLPFEAWSVDPLTVDMSKAEKFRRSGPTDWKDFWK